MLYHPTVFTRAGETGVCLRNIGRSTHNKECCKNNAYQTAPHEHSPKNRYGCKQYSGAALLFKASGNVGEPFGVFPHEHKLVANE
jgi:hypothetical protein